MPDFDLRPHIKPLTDELDSDVQRIINERPLLAHYCSIATLEKIVSNQEVWLSNPLFANDFEELRFGARDRKSVV